jgi:hypothetical protein
LQQTCDVIPTAKKVDSTREFLLPDVFLRLFAQWSVANQYKVRVPIGASIARKERHEASMIFRRNEAADVSEQHSITLKA